MPEVVIDRREKKPYDFPGLESIEKQINAGDYTFDGYENTFAVERKTLDDLATSLGSERDRFEREIQRAQKLDHFVVVIEAPASDVYEYAGADSCPNYWSDIHPNSVIATVEKWPQKYETLEFKWCGNREDAKQETLRLLDKWFVTEAL